MSKNVRSRFGFIVALIRSFVNDVIRKQKVEAKAVPPEGVYRQGNYPAPTPLWRTWWAEKRVTMRSFWPWARRVGKTSVVVVPAGKKIRVALDFGPAAFERLKELKEKASAETDAEVIRNSLRLYEWYLEQKSSNLVILLKKDGVVREVKLIFD